MLLSFPESVPACGKGVAGDFAHSLSVTAARVAGWGADSAMGESSGGNVM